jgi:hypothetical protein
MIKPRGDGSNAGAKGRTNVLGTGMQFTYSTISHAPSPTPKQVRPKNRELCTDNFSKFSNAARWQLGTTHSHSGCLFGYRVSVGVRK